MSDERTDAIRAAWRRHLLASTTEPVDAETLARLRADAEDWLDIWEPSAFAHTDMQTDRDIALELAASVVRLCKTVDQLHDRLAVTIINLFDQAHDETINYLNREGLDLAWAHAHRARQEPD
ncbi:MAG: hypothetical protein KG028_10415 [Actinobacteria bacterium]|jgi:hypothetical protein|nr:hypothetical protein [Actinomycetota bacterium]